MQVVSIDIIVEVDARIGLLEVPGALKIVELILEGVLESTGAVKDNEVSRAGEDEGSEKETTDGETSDVVGNVVTGLLVVRGLVSEASVDVNKLVCDVVGRLMEASDAGVVDKDRLVVTGALELAILIMVSEEGEVNVLDPGPDAGELRLLVVLGDVSVVETVLVIGLELAALDVEELVNSGAVCETKVEYEELVEDKELENVEGVYTGEE